jgi:Asp-tRNA(Asn)/Glu-tRNA(Gln) amidotransferase A subunit family amidase
MSIRGFAALAAIGAAAASPALAHRAAAQVEVGEATVRELQQAMAEGRTTSAEVTAAYLARIEAFDRSGPRLNAMIRLNPNALMDAEALDRERAATGPRGPLHGIPIVLKDNYDTFDMPTSAGTLALAGLVPPDDGFQVRRLREAGVVILGKTNMHELASGITTVGSLGGQTLNPYDPTRNPGGSSGGTGAAVAASFAALGWGSDTCGSIRIPSAHNNLVGLRPTKGLSSIDGIVPLSHTQDVGGPLARTVEDLAIALDATVGPDPADPATSVLAGRPLPGFVAALDPDALDGAVIGIFEPLYGTDVADATVGAVVRRGVVQMEEMGATVVMVEMPGFSDLLSGSGVIGNEFKWDLMDYLAATPGAPVASLGEMIELGLVHDAVVGLMRRWNAPEARDSDEYRQALAQREVLRDAILALMDERGLDALAYPTIRRLPVRVGDGQAGSACQLSAHTGLPALVMPAGWADGLPVGMELLGRPFDDARLVAFAYAYQSESDLRRPPATTPALPAASTPGETRTFEARATNGDAAVTATFELDVASSRLGYATAVTGVAAERVHAVVLRHADDDGRWSVAAHLSGPGVVSATGTVELTSTLLARLEGGALYLELVAAGDPFTTARAPLLP